MIRKRIFEKFRYDCTFVEWFVVVLESGDQTSGVQREEGSGFVVGVDFDVLVRDLFLFEEGPDSLDEGAAVLTIMSETLLLREWMQIFLQPARVELERLFGLMGVDNGFGGAGCDWVEVCIWVGAHFRCWFCICRRRTIR